MADGTITFTTELDNKQLEKELNRVKSKIQRLEKDLALKEQKRMPLVEQSKQLSVVLDQAKAKLFEMQNAAKGAYSTTEISEQKESVRALQSEWDKVQSAVERYGQKIADSTAELNQAKESAGEMQSRLAKAGPGTEAVASATARAQKNIQIFAARLREVVRSALVFTIISQGLASLREWMGKIVKTNSEATSAIAKLKGALLTLVQPLVNIILPAFTALVNILTRVVSALAQVFAMLTGATIGATKDAAEALNEETKALEGTGAAAEEAAGSLAGFDEINQINTESGGNSSDSGEIKPDFDFESNLTEDRLKNILGLIEAIGAAFLAWQIGNALKLNMGETVGLAVAIYSAIQFVKNLFDAWTSGIDWSNYLGILVSAVGLVTGLYIAFGKFGAGIGLIVAGIAMLVTGFHDAMENGWNLENLLTVISGIMLGGLGIGALVGGPIPFLIAAIASVILALTVAFGEGENLLEGVKLLLQGFIDFFAGIFTGDFERAVQGIGGIFGGLSTVFSAILNALTNAINSFFDWLEEKSGGKLTFWVNWVREFLTEGIAWIKTALTGLAEVIQGIFEGVILFFAGVFTGDWEKVWEGIGKIGDGALDLISLAVETFVNFFIRALNSVIGALNRISVTIPDWVPGFGGETFGLHIQKISEFSIPRLATGSVIPPNREFMAILGDNKKETEVVSPLSTMKQALLEALQESGGMGGDIRVELYLDGKKLAANQVKHINNMTRAAGKSVILV